MIIRWINVFLQPLFNEQQNNEHYSFDKENPFKGEDEEEPVASVGYRYRKWDIGNGHILVSRCEHDAVTHGPNGELQFINIKALNEWDSKVCMTYNIFIYSFVILLIIIIASRWY